MSNVLTPHKTQRGWIMELPPEMAQELNTAAGSLAVLYTTNGKIAAEILPPPDAELLASVRETYADWREAFEEMKRLGD